jgi:ABC-2 type transport system ATP-binding protein
MEHDTVIVTRGLGRDFPTTGQPAGTVRALDELEMEVPRGIVFGFLGPNGAGKTTTIRLLLGLLEPTRGSAAVLGLDTVRESAAIREQSGALLEHSGLYEKFSAEENLDFYGRVYRLAVAERRARIQELLEHLQLWSRRTEPLTEWSRGMRQKVAVARALLHRPRLLFLDEPTSGLDPVAAASLRDDLASVAEAEKVTVFLTTHNLAEAERLCALVAIVRSGRLAAFGSPAELRAARSGTQAEIRGRRIGQEALDHLRARPEVVGAELREGGLLLRLAKDAELAPIVTWLVQEGAEVEEVRRGGASLEEVFLELVDDQEEE